MHLTQNTERDRLVPETVPRRPFNGISPFTLSNSDRLSMAVAAYFDGAGKEHDATTKAVTLASYYATESAWNTFDKAWREMLTRQSVPYLHMLKLDNYEGPFKRFRDDPDAKLSLLADAFATIATQDIRGNACSVRLVSGIDNRKWLRKNSIKRIELQCVDSCLAWTLLAVWGDEIQLYFDKGENFAGALFNVINHRRTKYVYPALRRVSVAIAVNGENLPGIQAADMLAFSVNQLYVPDHRYDWIVNGLQQSAKTCMSFFDSTAVFVDSWREAGLKLEGLEPLQK
jgi:hypothetical protein